jgi:putative FmdB family regulatory protein
VPAYDYRCQTCDAVFEQRTTFDRADDVTCPEGHADVKRLLSVFAVAGRAGRAASVGAPSSAPPSGGGCCGGACGCG